MHRVCLARAFVRPPISDRDVGRGKRVASQSKVIQGQVDQYTPRCSVSNRTTDMTRVTKATRQSDWMQQQPYHLADESSFVL